MSQEENANMIAGTLTTEQTLHQAVVHQQAGQLQEAGELYLTILKADPNHPEANHNMGVLAVQMKQPAAGLPYFMAALDADPARGQYWLNYIDALFQAGQLEDARQVLALAQQQGLQGDGVEALALRLNGGSQAAEQPNAENQQATRESQPVSSAAPQNSQKSPKIKPSKPNKSTGKSVPHQGKIPSPQEIDTLVDMFNQGRFTEAASIAQAMTQRFPLHEFGWKALGALFKQMGRSADALVPMQKAAALSPGDVEAHYNLGVTLQDMGRLIEAESSYRRALKINPNYADAYVNLGVILQELGRMGESEASYRRALQIKPDYAKAHSNLGAILQKLGRLDEAEASLRRALQISQDNAETHSNLGNTLRELGRLDEAETSYRRALQIKPDYVDAYCNLGCTLKDMGRLDEAEASLLRALQISPDNAEMHNNLGITLKELGRLDEAEASYRRALQIKPDYAEAHYNLGNTLQEQGRQNETEASYRRALEIEPNYAEAHNNLGAILKELGRLDEAEASYRRALQIKPDYAEALKNLGSVLESQGLFYDAKACYRRAHQLGFYGARIKEALMLPAIMGTRQEMLKSRVEFERNLDELMADKVALDDPLKSVGEANFYLAFHGLNDRDLQVKVAKYYEQACTSLIYTAPHCIKPKSDTQKKIRVGFLSKFLYNHSVSFCFSKIIETLSLKEQFEVTLISSHPIDEKVYSEFAGKRVRLPDNLVLAREMVAALELDILVYLDIGMEPLGYFLAFSRLARAQCVLGGHPVTTGIANMDYFLSSDLMEPIGANEHYSERLVRLPRPLFYFARPMLPATLKTRTELGLPNGRHIYMCPMKLQKIHPDFDEAITRILQLDDNGVVVLFEDDKWPHWKQALLKRFESTLPAEVRERIIFLPWLKNPADFISAIATADVVLDPFHFGIGSTVAMASVTGTPLVTKTGEFMRGRVGAGYCEMLAVTECITEDTEGYAQKAVEIASDQLLRERISAKILRNSSALYENLQPVEDFVGFLYSLTDS